MAISPNNKIPAIVDTAPAGGGEPISVFESGAILLYLAEKTGKLLPTDARARIETLEWLFWQVGGLGPMTGQYGHFNVYAPEKIPYAIDRYTKEPNACSACSTSAWPAATSSPGGEYTIADIATYPGISPYAAAPLDLAPFANVRRWQAAVAATAMLTKRALR